MNDNTKFGLPGLNCGICGFKDCDKFEKFLKDNPEEIKRCIHIKENNIGISQKNNCCGIDCNSCESLTDAQKTWKDSLGRHFDFILNPFPNEQGPREIIIPHNPMITRELDIKVGDTLIGRPLGLSCGCPITHCGYVINVDTLSGVITWCVTGPLTPRSAGYKDLGYYSAQAYEGFVGATKGQLEIGMRYWFLPHRCMLQWRHSGLVNFLNNTKEGLFVRVEGLFIG